MSVTALIVAAGKGERLGGGMPKQFRMLAGKPVLRWAVEPFLRHPAVRDVRVIVGAGQEEAALQALGEVDVGPLIRGGAERSDSVRAGLCEIESDAVLVHDAARPFCPARVVDRLIASLEFYEGAAPVLPVSDTLARISECLGEPIDRTDLARVQTPQAFRLAALRDAYQCWPGRVATDETTVVRAAGMGVAAVQGDPALDKLTTPDDFQRAEQWFAGRLVPRTGSGFDVHAFAGEGPVMLGGIAVPHERGLAGHSDGDVVLHAITDALLGAAALGDIGQHFPPSDRQWEGASSDLFLRHAADLVRRDGGIIDHLDCTVIGEAPKVGPYRNAMRSRIATILGLREQQVSIKATTTEGLGFSGRREGLAAQAIASIRMPADD
jgi:2-C-methyl-D-erythritol 4-phosphate cytidylyltransferase / 2-C-methyl-D-erythritol 2,4-cyclodiphosphate synthase